MLFASLGLALMSVFSLCFVDSTLVSNGFVGEVDDTPIAQTCDENGNVTDLYSKDFSPSSAGSTTFYSPDPSDYIDPLLIFGSDDRTVLTGEDDYKKFPYRTVCLIHTGRDNDGDGDVDVWGVGTGVLVGPKTVLTASHLIYGDSWPVSVYVYPGGHNDSNGSLVAPYGEIRSRQWTIGVYFRTKDRADDWAIISLDTAIGEEIGYMGVSSSLSNGDTVRLYGYHGDLDTQLGYGPGIVSNVETFKFCHNCDAIAGSSGGPITKGTSTVVGIHSGGYSSTLDQACKVSDYIVGWIEEEIEKS